MTITQTVEIPADRRITLEVPREVPTGATARVEFNIIPFVKKEEKLEKINFTEQMIKEMIQDCPHLQALTGILHTDMTIEQIKEERLAKHLK